jgi:putative transposase
VFHVLNRGVGRMQTFRAEKDYEAFQRVVEETLRVAPIRICAYCWLPNHWHFVLWPEHDGDLSRFMQRLAAPATVRLDRVRQFASDGVRA